MVLDFHSVDSDGDDVKVRELTLDGSLLFTVTARFNGKLETGSAYMDKVDAERLYNALGDYLYGDLDDYDAEAIMNRKIKDEDILNSILKLMNPTAKYDVILRD